MRRLIVAAAFILAGGVAWANGYEEFMRAYEATRAGNLDLAATAFSAALNAGDLSPAYVPNAYLGRAEIYYRKGLCGLAATDLDAALKARPNYVDALLLRAHVFSCLGKPDAAAADLDAVIAVSPVSDHYAARGSFNWLRGNFAQAAADYGQAVALQPKRAFDKPQGAYDLAWLAISAARAGSFDAASFAKQVHDFDIDEWPGPILDFLAGTAKAEDVYRLAARGEGEAAKLHKCEADFYIGEWQIIAKNDAGKTLLQGVEQNCPRNSIIYRGAHAELKRIP